MAVSVAQPNVGLATLGVSSSEQAKVTVQQLQQVQMVKERKELLSAQARILDSMDEFKENDLEELREQMDATSDKEEKAQIKKEMDAVSELNSLEDFAQFNLDEAESDEDAYVLKTVDDAVEYIKQEDAIYGVEDDIEETNTTNGKIGKDKGLDNIDHEEEVKLFSISQEDLANESCEDIDPEYVQICKKIEGYKNAHKDATCLEVVEYMDVKEDIVAKLNGQKIKKLDNQVFSGLVLEASSDSLSEKWNNAPKALKLLIAADPVHALIVYSCAKKADRWTIEKFDYSGQGDKSDAYRHGIWNALITRASNRGVAKLFTTAYEDISEEEGQIVTGDGFTKNEHRQMDLHNNEIGRDQIKWYHCRLTCSNKKVKKLISNKLTNNRKTGLYWLHEKGQKKGDTVSSGSSSNGKVITQDNTNRGKRDRDTLDRDTEMEIALY